MCRSKRQLVSCLLIKSITVDTFSPSRSACHGSWLGRSAGSFELACLHAHLHTHAIIYPRVTHSDHDILTNVPMCTCKHTVTCILTSTVSDSVSTSDTHAHTCSCTRPSQTMYICTPPTYTHSHTHMSAGAHTLLGSPCEYSSLACRFSLRCGSLPSERFMLSPSGVLPHYIPG